MQALTASSREGGFSPLTSLPSLHSRTPIHTGLQTLCPPPRRTELFRRDRLLTQFLCPLKASSLYNLGDSHYSHHTHWPSLSRDTLARRPLSSVSVFTLYFQDVLTLHIHDFPSSVSRLELYFPNSQSIRCAPILTAKHSSTSTYWYYTVLNVPYIIPTHNRMIGLGQSYKRCFELLLFMCKRP